MFIFPHVFSKIKGKSDYKCMKFKYNGKCEAKGCNHDYRVVCGRKYPYRYQLFFTISQHISRALIQLQLKSSAQMQLVLHYHLVALLQALQPHRRPPLPQQLPLRTP